MGKVGGGREEAQRGVISGGQNFVSSFFQKSARVVIVYRVLSLDLDSNFALVP